MLIDCANPKGGVAKSTLAIKTAIELFDLGNRVACLDTDGSGPIAKTEIRCLDCLRDNHCVTRGILEDDRSAAQDIRNLLSELGTKSTTSKEIANG